MLTIPVQIDSSALEEEVTRIKEMLSSLLSKERDSPPATLYYRVKLNHVLTRGRALIFEPVLEQCSKEEAQITIDVTPD